MSPKAFRLTKERRLGRRAILRAGLVALMALLAGCSTPYLRNRARDGLDVFTFSLGVGAGAKARVGPIQTGMLYQKDVAGLRNGAMLVKSDEGADLVGLWLYGEASNDSEPVKARGKDYTMCGALVPLGWWESQTLAELPAHCHTQIEAVVGLGPAFRIGFNPGELLDFLLGWTTLDIYHDDVAKAPAAGKPEASSSPAEVLK